MVTPRVHFLGIVALIAAPMPVLAQPPPQKKSDIVVRGEKAEVRPEDKVVCRTQVETGSILARRTCKTQCRIDQEREESLIAMELLRQDRETAREMQNICGGKCGR